MTQNFSFQCLIIFYEILCYLIQETTEERQNFHLALTNKFEEWMVEVSSLVEAKGEHAQDKLSGVHTQLEEGVSKGKEMDEERYQQLIVRIEALEKRSVDFYSFVH